MLSDEPPAVPCLVTAGLVLCARRLAEPYGLALPSVAEILDATNATRSRAYELAAEIRALLSTLARSPGRPRTAREPAPANEALELRGEVMRFVMSHPGCVHVGAERARYAQGLRLFVLELRERNAQLSLSDFAEAIQIPLGTVEDWLRAPAPAVANARTATSEHDAKCAQVQTVLAAYRAWSGDFTSFCEHVRRDHRIEVGKTMIASILFAHGERVALRRGGRSRDEDALRGAFETFFPGAQWVGDGKALEILIDGQVFVVNLELDVDAASDAAIGVAVSDEEDSQAVAAAFHSGIETTGEPPLAILLDNRPSNHTPEVDATLGDTMRIRSTPGRAQNKAHVEGAFGLFAQKVPPIEVNTRDPRVLARTLATIVALTFFRALNRAPRRDRHGKTRVDLYAQSVTPEQRDAARDALRQRMRKQQLAQKTRAARLDPSVAALLDDVFVRLELLDPERHVRDAIACYPRDTIVDAIAIFDGKHVRGTLPDGFDARYLLGIVRNLHHLHEADATTDALIRERLAARDRFLQPLLLERDALMGATTDLAAILDALVDRLVRAERAIDRHFWIHAIASVSAPHNDDQRRVLARRAARRIHAAFRLATRERDRLERMLLRALWPLD